MTLNPALNRVVKSLLCAVLFLLIQLTGQVYASTLTAITSDRSAAILIAGAHQLLATEKDLTIRIRTISQIEAMPDPELQHLLTQSDSLILIAVFGESVERLLATPYPKTQLRTVLHSDRRLLGLQHDRHGSIFKHGQPEAIIADKDAMLSSTKLAAKQQQAPRFADWLQARAYWINRSVNNAAALLLHISSGGKKTPAFEKVSALRFALHRKDKVQWMGADELTKALKTDQRVLWIIDHDTGDLSGNWDLHEQLCGAEQWQCVSVLAAWGQASLEAVQDIKDIMQNTLSNTAAAVVVLQDFVIGGGEAREAVNQQLAQLQLPVLKGIRLSEWQAEDWTLSTEGIPRDSIHYRVAMPELQGISQPQVLALAATASIDSLTGAKIYQSKPRQIEVRRQARRLSRWMTLQEKSNAQKHIAVVYYNHPPGRHNIGADNLNVPESLLDILRAMKAAGYHTGLLPETAADLLDLLQAKGVNMPEDASALAAMSKNINTLSTEAYQQWFKTLPASVQAEMTNGPLGELQQTMEDQLQAVMRLQSVTQKQSRLQLIQNRMHNTITDLHHALDGVRHRGRSRALDLLAQIETEYQQQLTLAVNQAELNWLHSRSLVRALLDIKIEGIRGWGEAPGKVMVWNTKILIPGVQFGNVFLAPQPPRGWELNEELLHANMSFPPPHQYLAFYHYLQSHFKADAIVHLGRHSTYEFLPKRSVGLSESDYPSIAVGDLPSIYPYIVDGVGEGIQAKRRGLAVMVDHLTPPLAATELYDSLLHLRQLIESAEAANDTETRSRAVQGLRSSIDELNLRDELIASMDEELQVRGVGFDDVDDDFLLHEIGHYLTKLQEAFMPLGLHVFGRDWQEDAINTMISSMLQGEAAASPKSKQQWRNQLIISPAAEMTALLNGLNGRFVEPGKGNDPIRTPEALPTGRNFYALDGSLLPSRIGFAVGSSLAKKVLNDKSGTPLENTSASPNKQGVILWASDAVRDEGAMIAFGLKLLGVKPVWNSRGIIQGLERIPLGSEQPKRFDVVFTTSGLFRDLYGQHLTLLDKAGLMALDASSEGIHRDYPALSLALVEALSPLGKNREPGNEPLSLNQFANNWLKEASDLLAAKPDISSAELGRQSSLRVFGIAPGAYGAGVNRLVERSAAWQERSELGEVFIKRMGHAYGVGLQGEPAQATFRRQLAGVSQTFLGRASNLYGLIDNNDAFDYLGGFNLAVETVSGKSPASAVINHADNRRLSISNLDEALLSELRGRFFNPQWIKPLMAEGYSGARTMGSEFIEYLWGWQVTSPDIINDRVWEEVKAVYVDDQLNLGLDNFLAKDNNRYVQTNILAVMLVAIDKGFWQADAKTVTELAQQFAKNIIKHGNPGSGHSHANHPMYDLVKQQLPADQAAQLEAVLAQSRMPEDTNSSPTPSHIQEVTLANDTLNENPSKDANSEQSPTSDQTSNFSHYLPWLMLLFALLLLTGAWRGRRAHP